MQEIKQGLDYKYFRNAIFERNAIPWLDGYDGINQASEAQNKQFYVSMYQDSALLYHLQK